MATYTKFYRGYLEFKVTSTMSSFFPLFDSTKASQYLFEELNLENNVSLTNYSYMKEMSLSWDVGLQKYVLFIDWFDTSDTEHTNTYTATTISGIHGYFSGLGLSTIKGVMKITEKREDEIPTLTGEPVNLYPNINTYFLFLLNSEKKCVTKTNITWVESGYLQFNTVIKPTNFELEMKRANTDAKFNYMYVSSLHRYYYVDNVDLINNLMRLTLIEDVLYSWDELIRLQYGYVKRNESEYNVDLVDERRQLKDVFVKTISSATDTGALVNCHFSTDRIAMKETFGADATEQTFTSTRVFNFVVSMMAGAGTILPSQSDSETISNPVNSKTVYQWLFSNISDDNCIMDVQEYSNLCVALESNDIIATYIYGVYAYPFNVGAFLYQSGHIPYSVGYLDEHGTWITVPNTDCYHILPDINKPIIIADFKLSFPYSTSSTSNFLNYKPYTYVEFYIPFYGWVEMDNKEIFGNRIIVYYNVNYATGNATVFVQEYGTDNIIFSAPCQLGSKMGINTTNQRELAVQRNALNNNMVLGSLASILSLGVGVGTGNPLSLVGGGISLAKTLSNYNIGKSSLFTRGNTSFSDADSSLLLSNKVLVRTTTKPPLQTSAEFTSIYGQTNGFPLEKYMYFGGLSGYTEIGEIHFLARDYDIYSDEIDLLVNELENGVIF